MITTIIPTMASAERTTQLKRAIESVRRASSQPIQIIVVVNGNRFDTELCDWIKAQNEVRFEYVQLGSAPNAVRHGRNLVTTEYFCALDDDDEYLDRAIDVRLDAMRGDSSVDVVLTDGYRHRNGHDERFYNQLDAVANDPLSALFRENWLASGNALFRSSSVGPEYFSGYHAFLEWTWLAFNLAMDHKKIITTTIPTFRIHDTPNSLSKSQSYRESYLSLIDRMLDRRPPAPIERLIRERLGAAHHGEAIEALARGARLDAFISHCKSLRTPGGLRYLSFSRRLIPGWPN